MKKFIAMLFITFIVICLFAGCNKNIEERVIRFSGPNNLHSAAFFVMEELNLIANHIENVKIISISSDSGSAINEALIGGQIDVGLLGQSHFLIGMDKNVPYRIATPVSYNKIALVTNNPNIRSLNDIGPDDRIAVSSLTSGGAMFLYMACEQQLGDWNALKEQLVIIVNQEDALLALINKAGITLTTIDATSISIATQSGGYVVFEDSDVSDIRFMLCVFNESFYEQYPDLYKAFLAALEEAVQLINSRDDRALEIISKAVNLDKDLLIEYLDLGWIKYSMSMDDLNLEPFIDISLKTGVISSRKPLEEMIFGQR